MDAGEASAGTTGVDVDVDVDVDVVIVVGAVVDAGPKSIVLAMPLRRVEGW
jgi:hypothetical protein